MNIEKYYCPATDVSGWEIGIKKGKRTVACFEVVWEEINGQSVAKLVIYAEDWKNIYEGKPLYRVLAFLGRLADKNPTPEDIERTLLIMGYKRAG